MVIRGFGRCNTCDTAYMLRAGVGIEKYQVHNFDCYDCKLPVVIAVRANPPSAGFEAEENITLHSKIDENCVVINLHPNFAFTEDDIHFHLAFPSMEYVRDIMPHLRQIKGKRHQDVAFQFDMPNTKDTWGMVKNILKLESERSSHERLSKVIKTYEGVRRKYIPSTKTGTPEEVINNFFDWIFYPKINNLLGPSLRFADNVKAKNPDEFERFRNYFRNNIINEQYTRYMSIFTDYFRVHSQLGQMMVHARIGDDDVDKKIVGSKSFDDIKLYYGQAYETLTSSFVTLAALNNIDSGRKFDEFKAMTLSKYMKDVEKAKRANPFEHNPVLFAFATGLDSTLRNGSHHASIWRDGEKIYYRSGGSGEQRDITYARYMHLCNILTISLAAMWLLDRSIFHEA